MQTKTAELKTSITLKNIIFATDFSTAAENALPYAAELARRFGATLHVVNAAEPVNYALPPETWRAGDQARELQLKKARAFLQASFPQIENDVQVWEGPVWQVLASAIERDNADLIVLGTHGHTGVGKVLLGSATEEILRVAPCPVVTVGPFARNAEQWQVGSILYATDLSAASPEAAHYAVGLAEACGAKLTLLHVVEMRKTDELVHESDLIESSKRLLRKLVPEGATLAAEPRCEVRMGVPDETILQVAQEVGASLIVLGARKASGVPGAASHLPIATVHKIVTHAACPVVTVRHAQE